MMKTPVDNSIENNDSIVVAENELNNVANSIETASQKLAELSQHQTAQVVCAMN
jgi:hypothetical protein